jgi:HlyD family secretion protein
MKKRYLIIICIVILLIGGWFAWKWLGASNGKLDFRLSKVERGDIVQTVNATGTIQPLKLVQVGTQVTGPIKKLYADFNSRVKDGDIVAQIDPAIYEARVLQDKANLTRSIAEVERIYANLVLAEKELARSKELAQRDLISKSELDTAVATRDSLQAQLKLSEASVEQAKSALQTSQINLDYTTIKSPINGIVISRNVDEGQTVVASLSAQTLFTIAADLKKIEVDASLPEADVGKIGVGQKVTFTVDAYPDKEFSGKVVQVRLSPTTVQNVVTYTVVVHADNPEEKLFPGMTANLTFEVARRINVLKIPNSALRFTPDPSLVEPAKTDPQSELEHKSKRSGPGRPNQVWVKTETGLLRAINIKTGITDGSFTEVVKGSISEGQEIVTGIFEKGEAEMVNPFGPPRMPRLPRR